MHQKILITEVLNYLVNYVSVSRYEKEEKTEYDVSLPKEYKPLMEKIRRSNYIKMLYII